MRQARGEQEVTAASMQTKEQEKREVSMKLNKVLLSSALHGIQCSLTPLLLDPHRNGRHERLPLPVHGCHDGILQGGDGEEDRRRGKECLNRVVCVVVSGW